MKKALSLILVLVMFLGLCATLTACSNKDDSSKYVGVWKNVKDGNEYMYIYEDGTGDYYGKEMSDEHYNGFTWEVEGDYLVLHLYTAFVGEVTTKCTFDNDCLLNSQKKIVFRKHSADTTIDVK